MNPIEKLIEFFGGVMQTAEAIGVSHQLVYFWRSGERTFPADKCPDVERLTSGAIKCEDLRPDVDWAVLRKVGAGKTAKKVA